MEQKLKMLGLLLSLLIISWNSSIAQESINTTGGDIQGSGGSVSYSAGQVEYHTSSTADASVAEGVQQPYEISVITGIEEGDGIEHTVKAYPNPTINKLTLEVKEFKISTMTFQLYDMEGKLLQSRKLTSKQTQISMSELPTGVYFLKVTQTQQAIKTFKIVKTQ